MSLGEHKLVAHMSLEEHKLVTHLSTSLATLVMLWSIFVWLPIVRVRAPCHPDAQQTEWQAGRQTEESRRHGEAPGEQQMRQREDTHVTTQHADKTQRQGTPEAPPELPPQSHNANQAHGHKNHSASTASTPRGRRHKLGTEDISDSEGSGNEKRARFSAGTPKLSDLANRHDLSSHLPWLVSLGFATWEEDQSGKGGSRVGEALALPQGASSFELPYRPLKRLRSSTRSSPADEGGGSTGETSQLLACPFYRHDPALHRGCVGDPTLTDAGAVRYHVLTRHRDPLHCPICYVEFKRHADRDRHIVSRACKRLPGPPAGLLVGASATQAAQLAEQGGRGAGVRSDPATCWNQIWDILFPGQQKPARSQFVTEGLEMKAAGMRRFWGDKGPGLVTGALERKGALDAGLRPDASLEALFASVLDGMLALLEQKGQGGE